MKPEEQWEDLDLSPAKLWDMFVEHANNIDSLKKAVGRLQEENSSLRRGDRDRVARINILEQKVADLGDSRICITEGHSWEIFTAGNDPLFLWCHQCGKRLPVIKDHDEDEY